MQNRLSIIGPSLNQHIQNTEPLPEPLQTCRQPHLNEVSINVSNIWVKRFAFKMINISSKLQRVHVGSLICRANLLTCAIDQVWQLPYRLHGHSEKLGHRYEGDQGRSSFLTH